MTALTAPLPPLRVLLVDDEPLARLRLRSLLAECKDTPVEVVAEAGSASAARVWLREHACDLVLLDVQMPGDDGLQLARTLLDLPLRPWVVFVTAHAQHAVQAFEIEAQDYLTKPVRLERLQAALVRVAQRQRERGALGQVEPEVVLPQDEGEVIPIVERGRLVRVPLAEVLYFKAELKYLTVRTAAARHTLEGSLNDWEQRLAGRFLRIHRNALVAKAAVRELDRHAPSDEGESGALPPLDALGDSWAVRVALVNEWLAVSRRQVAAVREALRAST
ncbi:MAG: LytTR family DNA-binding domain-containing protein [Inhella sp.]|jgi:two-component system response regulator AlgR|uniref:LytR/AlgR family response regulator transcription factor n=1 Tax=Inhella sp. TaxID=1921806 RepID=UPI0022BEB450|nr:LytTR family DNA-binding domain-containing protein [Inhella sp.]MCZ8236528.1 LytTR family DNA-binding domain-containing protein [Inhella sp.]